MPDIAVPAVEQAIGGIVPAGIGRDLHACGAKIGVSGTVEAVEVRIGLGFPAAGIHEDLKAAIQAAVRGACSGVRSVNVIVEHAIVARAPQGGLAALPGAKNVIAVASGKGGVGKSTTTVNLALALVREGARVGILDADVYGPSQPLMLGLSGRQPESRDGKTFEPLTAHGLQVISVGFLVDESQPVIWRGPMVTQAIQQLAFQTNWQNLDFLLVDLPPGTGDTQLTLSQKVPLAGVVIVTTPQKVATQVARRGLKMFDKVGVPVLGIIENMSSFICSRCGAEEPLFGEGGGRELAEHCGVPLLGVVPLNATIRAETDAGTPPVAADPEAPVALRYREIARLMTAQLALRPVDHKHKFPKIVVEGQR